MYVKSCEEKYKCARNNAMIRSRRSAKQRRRRRKKKKRERLDGENNFAKFANKMEMHEHIQIYI